MTLEQIATEVSEILVSLGDELPEFDRSNVARFIKYNEHELALDTLCAQLCERGVVPTSTVRQRLMDLVAEMGMDVALYQRIVPQPKPESC
ncbi:MafI family immunity protein [Chondromyces apiculatus]|uniref:MafI family immunity protein n=1 Tax=Chondromyces apiculatus TaxID=51 RepID=UPI0018CC25E5|nr:MafI family immunity protein [Chondromyces apiculatus]